MSSPDWSGWLGFGGEAHGEAKTHSTKMIPVLESHHLCTCGHRNDQHYDIDGFWDGVPTTAVCGQCYCENFDRKID